MSCTAVFVGGPLDGRLEDVGVPPAVFFVVVDDEGRVGSGGGPLREVHEHESWMHVEQYIIRRGMGKAVRYVHERYQEGRDK